MMSFTCSYDKNKDVLKHLQMAFLNQGCQGIPVAQTEDSCTSNKAMGLMHKLIKNVYLECSVNCFR